MSHVPIITIDGPSGVGKGTLAQHLMKKTGFHLLDSGAIYRALAFGVSLNQLAHDDISRLVALAKELPVSFVGERICYKNDDITGKVRTEEVAMIASKIAAIPEVREALLQRQQDFAELPGLVADGRDMGTVVFTQANLKLFLTASAEVRAKRRVNQLKSQGNDAKIAKITQDIKERDERDANRSSSPLKPAADAVLIDTSGLNIEQVCEQAEHLLSTRGLLNPL